MVVSKPAMFEIEVEPRATGDEAEIEKAIIEQVEYYFSEANLPQDAHMLALTGGAENIPVNVSRIAGFPVMRKYKPLSRVKNALKKSTILEYTDKKHVRSLVPLTSEACVEPELIPGKNAPGAPSGFPIPPSQPAAKGVENPQVSKTVPSSKVPDPTQPWLTKGMLKPTGFEEYFADAPVTPAEFVIEQELYSQDLMFASRIETAIQRYMSKRKLHSDVSHILNNFLAFGGIDGRQRQFTGGLSQAEMDDMTAEEIASAMSRHFVAEHVEHSDDWTVDFAGVAKAYLSCDRILNTSSGSSANVVNFCNTIGNFYRYLLHHNVCPEYQDQINEAVLVCKKAVLELTVAVDLSGEIIEEFNRSCSALSGGTLASYAQPSDWDYSPEPTINSDHARQSILSAIEQLGSESQLQCVQDGLPELLEKVSEREMDLQVLSISTSIDADSSVNRSYGKLMCREVDRLFVRAPEDGGKVVTFWLEQAVLSKCFAGMKMTVSVCENNIGLAWIDRVISVDASYYEVIANDFFDRDSVPILPREWYRRQRTIKAQGYKPEKRAEEPFEDDRQEGEEPERHA